MPATFACYHTDPMVLPEPRYRCPLVAHHPGLAVMALGVARGAIEALIDLAAQKRSPGARSTLQQDHGAQTQLAQAEALVRSARLYLFDVVSRVWDDVLLNREPPLEASPVGLAAWHAVTSAARAVDLVYLTGARPPLCDLSDRARVSGCARLHTALRRSSKRTEPIGQVLYGLEPEFAPGRTRF